ncbi:MAG TPA: 2-octaprenyl-6-methoxyphenyl hydroxylase [Halioglobus sp.]
MPEHFDIVIAGGGMVGVSLALQLGAVLPPHTSVLLLESFPMPAPIEGGQPEYHPAFDARSTALSYGSRRIYEHMQVWDALSHWLCAIQSVHVSSRGHFGSALLQSSDYRWDALGYVVENSWLGHVLIQQLYRQARIEVRSPVRVVGATPAGAGVNLQLEGAAEVSAGLLLVADGAGSALRDQLGVAVSEKSYRQHAVVANVVTAEPHRDRAYERFTDEGPLALLPLLPTTGSEHRSALVWTLPPARARHLQQCPTAEFLQSLQERFGYRLGRLVQVGERHEFPLSLVRSSEQVRQGVVVMGNAAHALHPVAGQGFNLALRDVAELGRVLAQGIAAGLPSGDLAMLQRYQRRQQPDQDRTVQFSDRMPALFMHADPVLGLGRVLALAGLDIMPGFKREFVEYAAGVAGSGRQANG